jgi:predicted MFS family arabinose efflux permease
MQERSVASTRQIVIMAVTAGVTVANLYYNQPMLSQIARDMQLTPAQVGILPVVTQAAYGIGLFFLTPLGDMFDRGKLVLVLQGVLSLALISMTAVSGATGLYVASFLIGLLSVSVQIIMPMAAALARPETKGKVVAMVFTGALTGILGARILSGYIAAYLGWRWVYGFSACFVILATATLVLTLPKLPSQYAGGYPALLRSTVHQLVRFGALRRLSLLGALVFGLFCSFWTTLSFHLSLPPFNYGSDTIGLFGFLAIAGTMTAPVFGHLADKRHPAGLQFLTIAIIIVSVLCIQWWPVSVIAFVVATLLLDVGVQATQSGGFAQIYALDDRAHSRINTVYMTIMFIGGAIGTYAGVLSWSVGGWALVCGQLLLWAVLAMAVAFWNYRVVSRPAAIGSATAPPDPAHAVETVASPS